MLTERVRAGGGIADHPIKFHLRATEIKFQIILMLSILY